MGEEEHVLFTIVGDELRVERLRSQLASSARYRVSQTSLKELAGRCRPDVVVWHAGDRRAAEAGRRLCETAVVPMSGEGPAPSGGPVGVEVSASPLGAGGRPSLSAIVQALGVQAREAAARQPRASPVEQPARAEQAAPVEEPARAEQAPPVQEAAPAEPESPPTGPLLAEQDAGSPARDVAGRLGSLLEARARRQRGET